MNRLSLTCTEEALHYTHEDSTPFPQERFLDSPEQFNSQSDLASYLSQLEEEGYGTFQNGAMTLPWESLYKLLSSAEHKENFPVLDCQRLRQLLRIYRVPVDSLILVFPFSSLTGTESMGYGFLPV